MEEWFSEGVSLLIGLVGGATIGSFLTLKIVRSQSASHNSRSIQQRDITAGRDNIVGDVENRR